MRSRPVPRGVRLYDPATLARLCRARDYLADRFNTRTSLDAAAREACLSPFYFSRLFAEAFGQTPHEFVTRLRIERAKRLLLADGASVTDICLDVGYESLGSFSGRFRSLTGLSPVAFRREARRIFGFRKWRLFYVPACYQYFYLGSRGPSPLGPG
jgi:AraC-like DNA-binding protein